jgi:uncharacterized membrane-anchored protein
MSLSFRRSFRSSGVPNVDPTFWMLKVLTTAMGEATSDFFVHHYITGTRRSLRGRCICCGRVFPVETVTYWSAVVMVSVFGTMCADVVHIALGVPYLVSAIGFATALCVIFYS